MAYSLTWLPEVLHAAGLKVAEVPGWEERGAGDFGRVLGVLCHHTAGPKKGNMPSLGIVRDGRPGLQGPLSQLGLGRDGTYYVIAAGLAHHAGKGLWMGVTQGNRNLIGIEAENTGLGNDPWPAVQVDAYQRGVAAILRHAGLAAERCAGHKEYALPRGRKIDPTLDMVAFRAKVAAILGGTAPAPVLIPSVEPVARAGKPPRPTTRRGATGPEVARIQARLGIAETGNFDGALEARVRAFQDGKGLVADGIVGPKTWERLDA